MATEPKTYRVSPEIDTELRRLAKIHGGVDKALRVVFGWSSPVAAQKDAVSVSVEDVARRVEPKPIRKKSYDPIPKPGGKK